MIEHARYSAVGSHFLDVWLRTSLGDFWHSGNRNRQDSRACSPFYEELDLFEDIESFEASILLLC